MSEIESAYLEREQIQSTSLRDEYMQVTISLTLPLYALVIVTF